MSTRKGELIKKKIKVKNSNKLEEKHGKIVEMRRYQGGRLGVFFKDGQFRFATEEKNITKKSKRSPKKKNKKSLKKKNCKCSTKKCKCNCTKGVCSCNMKGGGGRSPIDLATAVKLLKEYYTTRYD